MSTAKIWSIRLLSLGLLATTARLAAPADTPSTALVVVNKEGSLAIVDPVARTVVATVRTGTGPHEVVASSDGKLAFVTNYGGGGASGSTISVIDVVAQKALPAIDLGTLRSPHGLAFAGGKLYFTAEGSKIIGRYDPATRHVDWLMGTGQNTTHMIDVNKDLTQICTSNIGSDSISIFDRTGADNWDQTVIPVGKGPEGFDVTPDGKELWAATSRDGGVSVINIANKRVTNTFSVQTKRSNRLRFTPDGRLALITDLDAGDLLVLDRATRKELKRMNLGHQTAGILISRDSSHAYVAVTADNNVAVINLKTLELEARIQTGTGPDGMDWAVR
jgi:DNA-binding beta-propeller fold protein YncE